VKLFGDTTLRTRLIAVSVMGVSVAVLSLTLVAWRVSRRTALDNAAAVLSLSSSTAAGQVHRWMQGCRESIERIAANPQVQSACHALSLGGTPVERQYLLTVGLTTTLDGIMASDDRLSALYVCDPLRGRAMIGVCRDGSIGCTPESLASLMDRGGSATWTSVDVGGSIGEGARRLFTRSRVTT